MIDGPFYPGLTHHPSLSAMRTPPLRMAEKAGACRIELMPPPLGEGREQIGQEP